MFKDAVTGHYYIRDSKFPTISSLIKHYQKFPINKDVNTFLLYPVQQEQEQEEYVALVPSQQGEREGGRGGRGGRERGREGEREGERGRGERESRWEKEKNEGNFI